MINEDTGEKLTPEETIEELRKALIRAAISQVLARNLSHNLGKHALNATKRSGCFFM